MITRKAALIALLVIISLISLVVSLLHGSADLSPDQVWSALGHNDGGVNAQIIHQLRLPRSLSAFAVGGLLGLSGTLMQVLLRNPLGDPYILGVSGGAAICVLLTMLLGLPTVWLTPAAFIGALCSMLLVIALAHRGAWEPTRLLLTGVVIAAGWSALISFILSISPPTRLPGMLFWLMGDLGDALSPLLPLSMLSCGTLISLWLAPALNIATRGEMPARALGVNVHRLQWLLYLLSSALTAAAVSIAGAVGFIGLLAPHMVRLAAGSDHRVVIPGSVLTGGSLLLLADTAARTVISPMQLPVGVLTAMIGVPVFLILLSVLRSREVNES